MSKSERKEEFAFTVRFALMRDGEPVPEKTGRSGLIVVSRDFMNDAVGAREHLIEMLADAAQYALDNLEDWSNELEASTHDEQ